MAKAESYTSTAKWLHWGMALLWIGAWFIGILATHWRDEFNTHHELTFLHKAMASTLLFLIVVRIAWRITHPAPALPAAMSPLMKRGAFFGHFIGVFQGSCRANCFAMPLSYRSAVPDPGSAAPFLSAPSCVFFQTIVQEFSGVPVHTTGAAAPGSDDLARDGALTV